MEIIQIRVLHEKKNNQPIKMIMFKKIGFTRANAIAKAAFVSLHTNLPTILQKRGGELARVGS
jgi:hypothetical protein